MKRTLAGLAILVLAACSAAGTTRDHADLRIRQAEYRGKVIVSGSEPATSVRLVGNNANVELVGSLEPELRHLSGAELSVRGALQGPTAAQRLEVEDYLITEIDGETPSTGVLQVGDGQLWLVSKDTLQVIDPPEALRARTAAKVWIVGRRSGDSLRVQSYGVIRE
jgi:hypothetical protein